MSENSNKPQVIDLQRYMVTMSIIISMLLVALTFLVTYYAPIIKNNLNNITDVVDTSSLNLEKSTVNIDNDPFLGNKKQAKIAIVEFSDFECPVCQSFHKNYYDDVISKYVDTNKAIYVFRDFPLNIHEPVGSKVANAGVCIYNLEGTTAFFNFAQNYYYATKSNGKGLPEGTTIEDIAKKSGFSKLSELTTCINDSKYMQEVSDDTKDGVEAGVSGTPNFIIGILKKDGTVEGVIYPGILTPDKLEQAIEEYL